MSNVRTMLTGETGELHASSGAIVNAKHNLWTLFLHKNGGKMSWRYSYKSTALADARNLGIRITKISETVLEDDEYIEFDS